MYAGSDTIVRLGRRWRNRFDERRAPAFRLGLISVGALVVSGCGGDLEPTDYAVENRTGFLTACARPLDDPRLLNDVCACAYDRIEAELRFDEFVELDADLLELTETASSETESSGTALSGATVTGDEVQGLPEEIVQIIADCFVEEAGL